MNARRTLPKFAAVAVLGLSALGFTPARAAGAAVCQVEATVTLQSIENLLLVNGGAGTISGTQVCEGSIAGAATNFSGTFSFCSHTATTHINNTNPVTGLPFCSNLADQPVTEPVHDALGNTPAVAHINASLSFTISGVGCNFTLLGHSDGILADLNLNTFKCTNGFGQPIGAEIARAQAAAGIVINPLLDCPAGPGGLKACFNTLAFAGSVEIVDQT